MRRYLITLQDEELEQLQAILSKGKHVSQKIINAQILLNCDEAGDKRGTERCSGRGIACVLRINPHISRYPLKSGATRFLH